MRNEAIDLLKEQLESCDHDIKACEIQILDCSGDPAAVSALQRVQAKYEALADQLKTEITALR
jgi:hypothetical protein